MGKPKPKGKWLKQGEEIIPSNEFVIENFEDGTSVLTITEIYPDDTGEIVYEAQNPLGVAVTTTELVVESVEGTSGEKTSNLTCSLFSAWSSISYPCTLHISHIHLKLPRLLLNV